MKKLLVLIFVLSISFSFAQKSVSSDTPWRHQIAIDGGVGIPVGEYADLLELETGFAFSGTYYLQTGFSRNLFLSASFGYQTYAVGYGDQILYEGDLNITNVSIGARYNFTLSGFQPYAGFEVGNYWYTVTNETEFGGDLDYDNLGIMPKVGLRYPIVKQLDFDANIKYHWIFQSDNDRDSEDINTLQINVGVAYTIGAGSRF